MTVFAKLGLQMIRIRADARGWIFFMRHPFTIFFTTAR
jgi:hypothetical protein